jgi:hypothetical protein
MRARKWGRIINITSIAAKQPVENLMLSNSLRSAVIAFRQDAVQRSGCRTASPSNNLLPGYTRTERVDRSCRSARRIRKHDCGQLSTARWEAEIPMRRLGEPGGVRGARPRFSRQCAPATSPDSPFAIDGRMDPERPVNQRSRPTTIRVLDWLIVVAALVTLVVRFTGGLLRRAVGAAACRCAGSSGRCSSPSRPHPAEALARSRHRVSGHPGQAGTSLVARDVATRRRPRWRASLPPSRIQTAAGAIGLIIVGLGMYWVQLGHMESVPDLGDPLFSMWRMGWVAHSTLRAIRAPFFDANIYYPTPLDADFLGFDAVAVGRRRRRFLKRPSGRPSSTTSFLPCGILAVRPGHVLPVRR